MPDIHEPVEPVGAAPGPALIRDQRWALHAYDAVAGVPAEARKDYAIAVADLGSNILRGGLSAALAAVQRLKGRGALLLEHLARARVHGLDESDGARLPSDVRALTVDDYILATREMLQVATWLKRAVQASEEDPTPAPGEED